MGALFESRLAAAVDGRPQQVGAAAVEQLPHEHAQLIVQAVVERRSVVVALAIRLLLLPDDGFLVDGLLGRDVHLVEAPLDGRGLQRPGALLEEELVEALGKVLGPLALVVRAAAHDDDDAAVRHVPDAPVGELEAQAAADAEVARARVHGEDGVGRAGLGVAEDVHEDLVPRQGPLLFDLHDE
jgi:hypothetical protein